MTPEAEKILLSKIASVVTDLNEGGASDPLAMMQLGATANQLCALGQAKTWAAFKQGLAPLGVAKILKEIDASGQASLDANRPKHAYALQAIALSLTAKAAQNKDIHSGAALIDTVIEAALATYRKSERPQSALN